MDISYQSLNEEKKEEAESQTLQAGHADEKRRGWQDFIVKNGHFPLFCGPVVPGKVPEKAKPPVLGKEPAALW